MAKSKRPIGNVRLQPSYEPIASRSAPLGSTASLRVQSNCSQQDMQSLMRLAKQVLADPNAVQKVGDRVYELMQEELRYTQDHRPPYRSRR